jgi:predicted dinucleotide-binding enzyme
MSIRQTLAIIGASGNLGFSISKSLYKGNYRLLLCSDEGVKVQSLIDDIKRIDTNADVEVIGCSAEASWEADIIIAAVPYTAEKEVAARIKDFANQKIVISISNPLNETYNGFVTEPGTSAAEVLQKLLPNAKVVKAFNTTFAADFTSPVIGGKQVDAFVAGNDEEAVQIVSELVRTAGFNLIKAVELSVSRTLEAMQLLLIQLTLKNNYNWLAGWKILHN